MQTQELLNLNEVEFTGIEPSKAEKIKKTFEPMVEMLKDFESKYETLISKAENEITLEITGKASELRKQISKVRIETGKLKDKQKEYIKLEDKAIMGVHNMLVWAVKEKEDNLRTIENHFLIQEKKRLEALQDERAELLSIYVEDAHDRDLLKFEEDEFQALLMMKKQQYEDDLKAKAQAEKQRIEQEKAEAEERKKMQAEYERLRKEAEKRKKENRELQLKAVKERKLREEKERKEREEYEAKLKAEQEEKERLQKELEAKAEAERKAEQDRLAKIESDKAKNDKETFADFVDELTSVVNKYSFKSKKYKSYQNYLLSVIDDLINKTRK